MALKVCSHCGYQNKPENRFSIKCGNPLPEVVQAPAEEPLPVSPSGVVYLYGDHFVRGGFLRGRMELPCRGVKVKKDELAEVAATAAFIGLAQGGYAKLYIDQRRGTLSLRKHKAVFLQPLGRGATLPHGFEGRILQSLSDRQGVNNAVDILKRLVPESEDPWAGVIWRVSEGLLEQGYFMEGERGRVAKFVLGRKLLPDCQRIAALQGQVEPVRNMIESFRIAKPRIYAQLMKDVRVAIQARKRVEADYD